MSLVSDISDLRLPISDKRSEIGDLRTEDRGPQDRLSTLNSVKQHGSHGALRSQLSITPRVALLTGGGDKPYALGVAAALTAAGITLDFIGSDDLAVPALLDNPRVNFLNLRGDQRADVGTIPKITRVLTYYWRLFVYATTAKPKVFHILWNNKFQIFDRTFLMLYYKLLGKKVILTAHNVNAGERDSKDSLLNRLSLTVQYTLCNHLFVHTVAMKTELTTQFGIDADKVTVVPFGINNTVPNTELSRKEAREKLSIDVTDKTLLFFGNIAPYKGLEYLIVAFMILISHDKNYRLLIVGSPKGSVAYWESLRDAIAFSSAKDRIIQKIEYVPDETTELYFKAADVLVLPYTRIFQSGVLFLGYSFGLPAIGADVGSLKEDIIEGKTGYVCRPIDSADLAKKIEQYFQSDLFLKSDGTRADIKAYANECYSWDKVAAITTSAYAQLLTR